MKLLLWLPQLVLLALLLYIFWRNRAMKRRQDQLVKGLKGLRYWRVNLARPAFYRRWLRVLPFEAKGVLIDEGDHLRIKGFWLKGSKTFDSLFDKQHSTVEWLGNRNLRAGNLYWARLATPRGELFFCADTGMYALPSREALADIFRSVFPEQELHEEQTSDFALEKNAHSVGAVALFFALFFFALLDTFVITRYELVDAQIAAILRHPLTWAAALGGLLGTLALVYRVLLGGAVPARESMVLSIFVSAALLGAALPLAKRVDQALAGSPAQSYPYRVTQLAHLSPADPAQGLPALRFPRAKEYWAQYATGSEYRIPLLHGPMGLWQLDHAEFDKPLIAFYEKQR